MQSGSKIPSMSNSVRHAPFLLNVYVCDFEKYLNEKRFGTMTTDGEAKTVYDSRNNFNRITMADA